MIAGETYQAVDKRCNVCVVDTIEHQPQCILENILGAWFGFVAFQSCGSKATAFANVVGLAVGFAALKSF
jgi:hypothetical protein